MLLAKQEVSELMMTVQYCTVLSLSFSVGVDVRGTACLQDPAEKPSSASIGTCGRREWRVEMSGEGLPQRQLGLQGQLQRLWAPSPRMGLPSDLALYCAVWYN